ncbi:hypothetical protein ACIP5U_31925 [Streptomyces sp. NPDC088788]|uniref:hypothetical protein n=1 Tax=Streptomyces sp. NPDC088788 TaxID=3365898 RepID=UPI003822F85E
MLRVLAAGAAVTAVAGAVVMRRWDTAAGKRVADLTRARASDEWRHDERVAELETDLDESRELRVKLEHKLRAKRTELAGLRNEHAALLRRYATAETERATALEGRRQLAIEASVPTRALPAARTAPDETAVPEPVDPAGFFGVAEAPDAEHERERPAETGEATEADGADPATDPRDDAKDAKDAKDSTMPEDAEDGGTAAEHDAPSEGTDTAGSSVDTDTDTEAEADAGTTAGADTTSEVFSPAGSGLFLRAGAALNRISSGDPQKESAKESAETAAPGAVAVAESDSDTDGDTDTDPDADPDPDAAPDTDADAEGGADPAQAAPKATSQGAEPGESALDAAVKDAAARKSAAARQRTTGPEAGTTNTEPPKGASRGGAAAPSDAGPSAGPDPSSGAGAEDGGAQGKPEAVGGHQRAAAEAKPSPSRPAPRATPADSAAPAVPDAVPAARAHHPVKAAEPAKRSGHFTVPTAVAVVPPTAPVRRPSVEGGFDFFGTQKEASDAAAMEAVQNEDLADVVGQEALALHKAEAESGFRTAREGSLGAGQVIDLTAHDETEQIDVAGLRSAAS